MPIAAVQQRPAQLQVNTAGAWKTVVTFDASSDLEAAQIQEAVEVLHQVDQKPSWRIATVDSPSTSLRHLSRSTNGHWVDTKEPQ